MSSGRPDLDLLVAGGGPAGLATAIEAVSAGLSVLVVEPRATPVDKACGEGLMPGAVDALLSLGVAPRGRAFTGIRYVDGRHQAEARFAGGSGLGVRRTVLHEAMAARARELGIETTSGRTGELRQHGGHVEYAGHRARYLVAADGLHSPIRAALGLDAGPSRRAPVRYGIRRHYACAPWTDLVEVHWSREAEVYVTPVDDDLVGVAVLGGRGSRVDDALDALPGLAERLAGARPAGPDRGAGPLRQRARSRVAGRVLLVGDAGGYVDALTGEGLRLAFEEARAAVGAVARERPSDYAGSWRRITATYRLGAGALVTAGSVPAVRRRIVPAAARHPGAFTRCVRTLAGS